MTEELFSGSDEEDLSSRTWKKHERDLEKTGFREGALKGQEESYQTGFDIGYSEGFRIGEVLGFSKAALSLKKQWNTFNSGTEQIQLELVHDSEEMRACVICHSEDLLESSNVHNIVIRQQEINNSIISKLFFKNSK